MKYYKLKHMDDRPIKIVRAHNILEVVKKYDLASRENIDVRVYELEGEQRALDIENYNNKGVISNDKTRVD